MRIKLNKIKIINFICRLIPNRNIKFKLKNRLLTSIAVNNGKNNKINILDCNGNKTPKQYIKNLQIYFTGENSSVTVYENLKLKNMTNVILKNNSKLEIGNTDWELDFSVYAFISDYSTLKIGNNVSCGKTIFYICDEPNMKITINDNCMFSSDIAIRSSDAHIIVDNNTGERNNPSEDITIGEHTWIGMGATILKGAHIPDNSIIGAHSVYTKSSNPTWLNNWDGGIFVGQPAKLKKTIYCTLLTKYEN